MPTIFIKDSLRASVEAASGGKQTVLYTGSGQPTYMNVIPQFNLQDVDTVIGTGVHPAFIVNGITKSEITMSHCCLSSAAFSASAVYTRS